jgi:hypothetical protein
MTGSTRTRLGSCLSLYWVFPNMVLGASGEDIAVALLQATGVQKTLARCFLLSPESQPRSRAEASFEEWISHLKERGTAAEELHRNVVTLGTSSRPGTRADSPPIENNPCSHALNRFLAQRLQLEHHYYWTAPIMDAAMMMRGSR